MGDEKMATGLLPEDFPKRTIFAAQAPPITTFEELRAAGDYSEFGLDAVSITKVLAAMHLADSMARNSTN